MKKHLTALLLSLLLVLVLLPAEVSATGGSCGSAVTWSYDAASGKLTISGEGDMTDLYSASEQPWAEYRDAIYQIVVEEGVTSLGNYAFSNCRSVLRLTLPESLESIGAYAMWDFDGIKTITIPENVSEISDWAFASSDGLTEITIPAGVTKLSNGVFSGCVGLETVNLPNGLTEIGEGVFANCEKLCSLDFPSGLTVIGRTAFYNAGLRSADLPDSLTRIEEDAFYFCALETVSMGSGAYTIGDYAFAGCSALREAHLGGVTEIGTSVFTECYALESVSFGANIRTIGNYAFSDCYDIKRVEITDIAGWCSLELDSSSSHPLRSNMAKVYVDGALLTELVIPEGITTINREVFYGFRDLKRVVIPEGVTSIGWGAFQNCYVLEELELPDSLTVIGDYAFVRCCGLKELRIPANVIALTSQVFGECTELKNVYFEGDAPLFGEDPFFLVTADCFYPVGNATWTEDVMLDYGGELTWAPFDPANPFTDVPLTSFYYAPVMWAVENGITNGLTATEFGPDAACNRAQVVTFLWRAEGCPEPTATSHSFVDVQAGSFYEKAVLWAVENGITTGTDATHFSPNAVCNRATVVTFLHRAAGAPAVENANNPFSDVPADGWFTDPVLWAVEQGITNGLSATEFGPTANCNRAQVVTFLYRAYTA